MCRISISSHRTEVWHLVLLLVLPGYCTVHMHVLLSAWWCVLPSCHCGLLTASTCRRGTASKLCHLSWRIRHGVQFQISTHWLLVKLPNECAEACCAGWVVIGGGLVETTMFFVAIFIIRWPPHNPITSCPHNVPKNENCPECKMFQMSDRKVTVNADYFALLCFEMHRCPSWTNKLDLHVCWLRATTHLSTVVSFCVMLSDIKSSLFSIVPLECIHIATDIFNCRDENRFDSYVECRTRELPSWGNTPNTESLAVFFEIVLLMGHYCLSSRKYWRSLFHLLLSVLVFRLYLCATTEQVSSQQMILKAC